MGLIDFFVIYKILLINNIKKTEREKTEKIFLFLLTIAGYKHGVPAGFEEANQQGKPVYVRENQRSRRNKG